MVNTVPRHSCWINHDTYATPNAHDDAVNAIVDHEIHMVEFDGVGANINCAVGIDVPTTLASLAIAWNGSAAAAKMARNQLDTGKADLITTSEAVLAFRTDAPTLLTASIWQPGERSVVYVGSAVAGTVVRICAEVR